MLIMDNGLSEMHILNSNIVCKSYFSYIANQV
jgi:hypothetical protein